MTIKNLTLGACLLLAGSASAQTSNHIVREGETLSGIAAKYGVGQKAILKANNLRSTKHLKVGSKLRIPTTSQRVAAKAKEAHKSAGGYAVREGDNDWIIAKRFKITPKQLREMNPGTNWSALQVGREIRVPGRSVVAKAPKNPKSAVAVVAGAKYVVREGDNDWIIAKQVGITPSALKRLNPDVNLSKLHPGQKLAVPGRATKVASTPILKTRYAVVTGDDVSLRRKPSTDAARLDTLDSGTHVTILDHESGWYKLRSSEGAQGWVKGTFLRPLSAEAVAGASRQTKVATLVSADGLQKKSKKKAAKAAPKATLVAIKESGATREGLLERANTFRGVRYSYGAMSRSATDCSGFTSQVFRSIGVKLPRTALQQSAVGQRIDKDDLKPGDLVFFRTSRSTRINHVGIYIGSGHFIHASSGGGEVMESALTEGYYKRCFATARRVAHLKSGDVDKFRVAGRDAEPDAVPIDPETGGPDQSQGGGDNGSGK